MKYYGTCIGEFGRVFKGTWTHQNDGREITEEVAVKTIKSMILFSSAVAIQTLIVMCCNFRLQLTRKTKVIPS